MHRIPFITAVAYTVIAALVTCWNVYAAVTTEGYLWLFVAFTAFWTVVGATYFVPTGYGWMRRENEHRKQHPTP